MHCLLRHHLDYEGNYANLLIVEKSFDPIGARNLEGCVIADRDITMALRFFIEAQICLRLREYLLAVRSEEPDFHRKISPTTDPFVHDCKAVVHRWEGMGEDAFKEPHETEFAAHLLSHIVADEGKAQLRLNLNVCHNRSITYLSNLRQSVFS